MTDLTTTAPEGRHLGLAARIIGVLLSPRETYADVAARPRILGVLLVTLLVSAGATFWFQSTAVGQKAVIEQAERALDAAASLGLQVPDQAYEGIEKGAARAPYQSAASILILSPIMTLVISAVFLGVFNGILGGKARFKQVFAVLAHAGVISTLLVVFNSVMGFVRGDAGSAASLGVFFPMLPEMGFATYLLRYLDIFTVWALISMAIGLGVLYRRRTGPIAIAIIGIYLCVGVLYAAVRAFVAGA